MRINFCDDEERPGQFALWDANCQRSLKGKAGQQALRDLEAALLALPEKRLIHGLLEDEHGAVCAVGAYAKHKGLDLSKFDPEDESDAVGVKAGMPRLVAWKVVALNDIEIDDYYRTVEGPEMHHGHGDYWPRGVWQRVQYTPEERYEKVLAWVRANLEPKP